MDLDLVSAAWTNYKFFFDTESPGHGVVAEKRRGVKSSVQVYSRKVFLGGLPPDVDDVGILTTFAPFKPIYVDWPGKIGNAYYKFPPKGFAFLYFACEESVHQLVQACWKDGGQLYYPVSSLSTINKLTQVRPWKIADAKTIVDKRVYSYPRYPVFVGGIPRPMTSTELAEIVNRRFGNVGYAAIFLDSKTCYPRGSGVIVFTNFESYRAAINQHYVLVDQKLRCVELKPYSFSNGGLAPPFPPVTGTPGDIFVSPSSPDQLKSETNFCVSGRCLTVI